MSEQRGKEKGEEERCMEDDARSISDGFHSRSTIGVYHGHQRMQEAVVVGVFITL